MNMRPIVRAAGLLLGSLLSISQAMDQPSVQPESTESGKSTTVRADQANDPVSIQTAQPTGTASPRIAKPAEAPPHRYPAEVTPYDFMTPEDEFFYHHLEKLCLGSDIANWPLVKQFISLGLDGLDAKILADMANETIYISDQPRAAPIVQIVRGCAEVLQIEPPPIFIKGSPFPNAWVTRFREPHVLVITSGMLQLYQEAPEELRFVIGHELGHLKSKHLRTQFLGRMLLLALVGERSVNGKITDDFVLALSLGSLLHWIREAEYTADRAGLICVGGNVEVAKQALLRLLHQTPPSNLLMDPKHKNFDSQLAVQHAMRLRERPLVQIISWLNQFGATHPFIPDRSISLEHWANSKEYKDLHRRPKKTHRKRSVVVTKITVTGIPKTDVYVPFVDGAEADPKVTLTYSGKSLQTDHSSNRVDAEWNGLDLQFEFTSGAGLIVDVHDVNAVTSNRLLGSVRLPIDAAAGQRGQVRADLRLDIFEKNTIIDRPVVTVEYRIDEHQ